MRIEIALTPKQSLFDRMVEKTPKVLYGGAKGGGKSHGLRLIMLKRRIQYPGSIGYIFRRTYPELRANHIEPMLEQFPQLNEHYHDGDKTLHLPNGSKLCFGYVDHKRDLIKFQGREMHDLAIEEAGEWPFQHYEYLEKQRRSAKVGIKPRTMLTGNPGGEGHVWLKRLFIDRRYDNGENPDDYAFIKALVEDNPALMAADPNYVRELETIKNEALRRAWRYGDWDIQAGAFFSELRREVHLVKPFEIPAHWKRFAAYDYGFGHPASFGWYTVDEDGCVYKYRELVVARHKIAEFAAKIWQHKDTSLVNAGIVAGHDCWARKGTAFGHDLVQPTIAEEFAKHKLFLIPASIDRIQGAARMREYLSPFTDRHDRVSSKFRIFESCPLTFDTISRMVHDPDNLEDVLKVDAVEGDPETGDDAYDETRYALMTRPPLTKPVAKYDRAFYRKKKPQVTGWTV